MSVHHRLLACLLLLGILLHAPLPLPRPGPAAPDGLSALSGFCGSPGQHVAALLKQQEPLPAGGEHGSAADEHWCCLLCEHPDSGGLPGKWSLPASRLRLLSLQRIPPAPPRHWLQPISAGTPRAPPQV